MSFPKRILIVNCLRGYWGIPFMTYMVSDIVRRRGLFISFAINLR